VLRHRSVGSSALACRKAVSLWQCVCILLGSFAAWAAGNAEPERQRETAILHLPYVSRWQLASEHVRNRACQRFCQYTASSSTRWMSTFSPARSM
jgi:hypothetical protein